MKEDPRCESDCPMMYFCVCPLLVPTSFNINTSVADYWVGCQVASANRDCSSSAFTESDCYDSWSDDFVSGFAFGKEGRVALAMIQAVENSVITNHIIVSGGRTFTIILM
jgi:hypothetical protein